MRKFLNLFLPPHKQMLAGVPKYASKRKVDLSDPYWGTTVQTLEELYRGNHHDR